MYYFTGAVTWGLDRKPALSRPNLPKLADLVQDQYGISTGLVQHGPDLSEESSYLEVSQAGDCYSLLRPLAWSIIQANKGENKTWQKYVYIRLHVANMSRVKWGQAQDDHRDCMAEAFAYASQATRDPEIKEHYLKMALKEKKNNRPYDMAVSDYFHNRNNLLGSRFYWSAELWRAKYEERQRILNNSVRGSNK